MQRRKPSRGDISLDDLKRVLQANEHPAEIIHRVHTVHSRLLGVPCRFVSRTAHIPASTVEEWCERYLRAGIDALLDLSLPLPAVDPYPLF